MPQTRSGFLVISATRAEAAHLPAGVEVLITGVGKVAAATATATALATRDTSTLTVLNIGTAGALRPGLAGLFTPGSVLNHDLSATAIRQLGFDVVDELPVAGGDDSILATGDLFVSDPAVRDQLAQRAHLVDMEGYAIAWACAEAGVAFRMAKHVSDNADDSALDWVDAVDASARVLGAWVATQISENCGAFAP